MTKLNLLGLTLTLSLLYGCGSKRNITTESQIVSSYTTISGTVTAVQAGKDGYTAEIRSPKDEITSATISIPNLLNGEAFVVLKPKSKVVLKGEAWMLDKQQQLTVRKIISTDTDNFTVNGKVGQLQHGTDGYTAEVIADDGEVYFATVSIPNLGENHEKFRTFKKGDRLQATGELWLLGSELRLTVRDLLP